jgi:DNA-directed RNA polymerase specialized sigma24 family protein
MTTQNLAVALQQSLELAPASDWTLTATAFELLLKQLDNNPDGAALKYISLYTKLTRYFDWRGCDMPDWHADETMTRVARRIEQGAIITNFQGFMFGVARRVAMEASKEREKEQAILTYLSQASSSHDSLDQEELLSRLEASLLKLNPKNRELLLAYYASSDEKNMEVRRKLAEREGISINSLRVRVHRFRLILEDYVKSECDGCGHNLKSCY